MNSLSVVVFTPDSIWVAESGMEYPHRHVMDPEVMLNIWINHPDLNAGQIRVQGHELTALEYISLESVCSIISFDKVS